MKLALVTDSTCDLSEETLHALKVRRVPLYLTFKGQTYRDWVEITPREIIEGVKAGAAIPTTSQPSPRDFENIYRAAAIEGAEKVLCITLSGEVSGTYQSAMLGAEKAGVPVTVFDSRAASLGLGAMVERAATMRDAGADLKEILRMLEQHRDNSLAYFTLAGLEFLKKGGRIGRASALLGGLLSIKPILAFKEGKIEPAGRARGAKKALKEIVSRIQSYAETHPGNLTIHFVHVLDEADAETLRQEATRAGISFTDGGTFEVGTVLASHVGPGTYGAYLHGEAPPS
jgi:DegV family protein with EDD domain